MNEHETDIPIDIQNLAHRLAEVGTASRARGEEAAYRVAIRTSHVLREGAGPPATRGVLRFWMWLAAPATVLGAVLLAMTIMRAGPGLGGGAPNGGVVAANLESDIDTWMALDEMLREESFENSLAVLSLDTAGVATRSDEVDALPRLESGS